MIIGTAYYPEHWEKERWKKDAQLMQEMGINTVRMGEFGWAVMEATEGNYDFSLYEEAISLLAEYGIHTIMGTPTAAPPAWFCRKHPDIYMEDREGRRRGFGSRRHYCYRHRAYGEESEKITKAMGKAFGKNPHIIAWQIDNELGCEDEVRCYCENCRQAFIEWLRKKYGSLMKLNENWGTVFWSQTYTHWNQIVLPKRTVIDSYTGYGHNPGLLLDFARFSSDSLIEYAKKQCDMIRAYTDKPIVHNVVSEFCDNYKLSEILDRAGYDAYPRSEWDVNSPGRIGFHYDLTRGYKKEPFWILEQQSGPCGWNVVGPTPKPGELKLWSIQGAAKGAEALIYFRWRTCLFGTEQFWYGILNHDGIPGKRYEELKEAACEIQKYSSIFKLPNQKQILFLYDYDNKFSHEFQPQVEGFQYKEEVIKLYESFQRLHLQVDIGRPEAGDKEYAMVVYPFGSITGNQAAERLKTYVREGGTLVLTAFSGLREENNQITEKSLPGIWKEAAGVMIEEFLIPGNEKCVRKGTENTASRCEVLKPLTAEMLPGYDCGQNNCTVSVNRYGKGRVYYIGCLYETYDDVLEQICNREGQTGVNLPEDVECIVKAGGRYLILFNHSEVPKRISMNHYVELESRKKSMILPETGYGILEKV